MPGGRLHSGVGDSEDFAKGLTLHHASQQRPYAVASDQRWQRWHLLDDHGNDQQGRQQQPRTDDVALVERSQDAVDLGGVQASTLTVAEKGVQNEREQQARHRGVQHVPDVLEEVGASHGWSEVGRVAQRRELVTEVGSRDDRTSDHWLRYAQPLSNTHQRDADRRSRGPGRASSQRDDAADCARSDEEDRRREELEAVVHHARDDARLDP